MRLAALWLTILTLVCGCGAAAPSADAVASPSFAPGAAERKSMDFATVEAEDSDSGGGDDYRVAQGAPPAAPSPAPLPPGEEPPAPNRHDGSTAPLLIYTANYTVAVFEVKESLDKVQALAKELGGYLVERNDQSITVRVPAEKYRGALGDIAKIGDVLHHQESVQDVTDEFHDMVTRLTNARAVRARLQELLAAAKDVTEALSVERELARVTEEIELMEGKLKRLKELINFSTITVTFSSRASEQVTSNVRLPFPWLDQLGLGPLLQLQ
jgi:hypothetical protein